MVNLVGILIIAGVLPYIVVVNSDAKYMPLILCAATGIFILISKKSWESLIFFGLIICPVSEYKDIGRILILDNFVTPTQLFCCLGICWSGIERKFKKPLLSEVFFIIIIMISWFLNPNKTNHFFQIVKFFCFYLAISQLSKTKSSIFYFSNIFKYWAVSSGVYLVSCGLFLNVLSLNYLSFDKVVGAWILIMYLVGSLPYFLAANLITSLGATSYSFLLVFSSHSRALILGFFAFFFFWICQGFKKRILSIALILGTLLVGVYFFSPLNYFSLSRDSAVSAKAESNEIRIDKLLMGINVISQRPLFGHSFSSSFLEGNIDVAEQRNIIVPKYEFINPESLLLQIAIELGIIGLLTFSYICFKAIGYGIEIYKQKNVFQTHKLILLACILFFITLGFSGSTLNNPALWVSIYLPFAFRNCRNMKIN